MVGELKPCTRSRANHLGDIGQHCDRGPIRRADGSSEKTNGFQEPLDPDQCISNNKWGGWHRDGLCWMRRMGACRSADCEGFHSPAAFVEIESLATAL